MKKKFLVLLIMLLAVMVLPSSVLAADSQSVVASTGLKETIEEEISNFGSNATYANEISILENVDLSNYTESSDKVNVYIFRGSTCSHCLDAVAYFASIVGEYGKYFNVVTYETWSNTANASLMSSVAKVMGDSSSGVPYIVIGDESYIGFTTSMEDSMLSKITSEYKSNEKYDVMDHLNDTKSKSTNSSSTVTILLIVLVLAGGIALIYYVNKADSTVTRKKEVTSNEDIEVKPEIKVEPTKKTTTKKTTTKKTTAKKTTTKKASTKKSTKKKTK